jgi:16S rRNA (uracil1498-N3)-methyltransferase
MKHTFYAPPEAVAEGIVRFPEDEAHHAVRVLRLSTGDEVAVVDGNGNWYRTTLNVEGRRDVVGKVLDQRSLVGEPSYELTVGVGMLKSLPRFETFLEKAVELGVARVVPLVTDRSEKQRLKPKRAFQILVTAMKQCGRSRLVELAEPIKLRKWLKTLPAADNAFRAVCHESASGEYDLSRALQSAQGGQRFLILVGPEGGFSEEEIDDLNEAGFSVVSLGPRRFRTETAAMLAAAAVMERFDVG